MKKVTCTTIQGLAIIGALIWSGTVFMRGIAGIENQTVIFILGIAPNFGAALLLPMVINQTYSSVMKKPYNKHMNIKILVISFLLILGSEIVHDLFLNSPFDKYDIIFVALALIIVGTISLVENRRTKINW